MEELPKRKPTRLPQYDYGENGGYFLTVCTEKKVPLLWYGTVLSPLGQMVQQRLEAMTHFYENMTVDKFVVMPNHIHLILMVQRLDPPSGRTAVPRFISAFKRLTAKEAGHNFWQRSYHDHVIRNYDDYLRIWKYIDENPIKWCEDRYFID